MIWFTSDLHLGHEAAIRMCDRPFETVDEMNEVLIKNFNDRVKKHDTVYILGDIAYRTRVEVVNEYISRLNGKKYLCIGNHDKRYDPMLFEDMKEFMQIHVNGQNISLMHYPMMEWPKSRHGAIHLHGHQHNKAKYNYDQRENGIRRYDVGVDANNYCPISLEEIIKFMDL